jgi:N utilization substance protein B
MGRKSARKCAFQIVFQIPFDAEFDYTEAFKSFCESSDLSDITEDDKEYIQRDVQGVYERLFEINELISAHTMGWDIERINRVDLAIIRLAVYEMKYADDIPAGVAINEAVELAKEFGSDDSPAFINGILGTMIRMA